MCLLQMDFFFVRSLMNGLMFMRILCGESGTDALKPSRSIIQWRGLILFSVPIYWNVFFKLLYMILMCKAGLLD